MKYASSFYPFHYKVLDYAGLYPPASLQLNQAISNYSQYKNHPENWMLSRFIISGTKLKELIDFKDLFFNNPPFTFSIVGGQTNTTNEFKKDLDLVISNILDIETRIGPELISIECLELKVPVLQDTLFVLNIISDALLRFECKNPLEIFLEFNLSHKHNEDLKLILRHIKEFNFNNKNKKIKFVGYKVRTGGIEAKQFPSIDKLASIIFECNNFNVLLKATAGLHHPIRRYDNIVQTHMYGFINVISASIFSSLFKIDFKTIYDILQDEDPKNFSFSDQKLKWRHLEATKEQIEFSRIKSFYSFGSCSFDEPITDLQSLGLLQ
jgi:hypothetical protein